MLFSCILFKKVLFYLPSSLSLRHCYMMIKSFNEQRVMKFIIDYKIRGVDFLLEMEKNLLAAIPAEERENNEILGSLQEAMKRLGIQSKA